MEIKQMIREALTKKLEGDVASARADLLVFLNNPTGVADHIEFIATAEKKLEALSNARDKLNSLKNIDKE